MSIMRSPETLNNQLTNRRASAPKGKPGWQQTNPRVFKHAQDSASSMDVSYHTMQPCSHYSTAAVQLQQDHTNWIGTALATFYTLHVSMHLVTRPNLDFSVVLINDKDLRCVRVLSCVEWYGTLVLLRYSVHEMFAE